MKQDILDTISSPLVRVSSPPGSDIAAKLESFNPGRSAKDRPALAMIEAAEQENLLEPGGKLVEPTSGNTGIGLAIVAAVKGYDLTIVMPASKSVERRQLLRAYGATVELVDGDISDARDRANEIANETGAIQLDQFSNTANISAHYETTAAEILTAVDDREITAVVLTVGTGGTIMGVGKRLREVYPDISIIAVEPAENAVISTGEPGSDDFQGMGPGFISDILDVSIIDSVETVSLERAEAECRRLAREEGILVGQSSGAAKVAANRVASRLVAATDPSERDGNKQDPLIVTIFPDSGERYLSAGTFGDVTE